MFHHPFDAGWVVPERFGIEKGKVKGNWEPVVSIDEFERGKAILLKHGNNKSRFKKQFYLLRNMLWVKEGSRTLKMFGSTPSGSHKSYAYYITNTELNGEIVRLQTQLVDEQIPSWLAGITIDPDIVPEIRELYHREIQQVTTENKGDTLEQLKRKRMLLKEEEANLARLMITGKITEDAYDKLRAEWQEKLLNLQIKIEELEVDTSSYLDDLDLALVLLSNVSVLYQRMSDLQKNNILQILVKRFIINREGEIISHELHPPFSYLSTLIDALKGQNGEGFRSEQITSGVQNI